MGLMSNRGVGVGAEITEAADLEYKQALYGNSDRERRPGRRRRRTNALLTFSSIQLAEWIIVIEGLRPPHSGAQEEPDVVWEVVLGASSSDAAPRVQYCRFGRCVVATWPISQSPEASMFATPSMKPLRIPPRVGKVGTT